MKKLFFTSMIALTLVSCAELLSVASTAMTPTNAENVAGLKSALNIGIQKAVEKLGITNGFFTDLELKLLLPKEAEPVIKNIRKIPGGSDLVDRAVLSLNRTAEDAVKEAGPIFVKAITNMSISDAMGILFGGDHAATDYLKKTTYRELQNAFAPKVAAPLGKPLVANTSTTKSWNTLMSAYNSVANTPIGSIAGMTPVNVNLEEYVTQKALDGLFFKIADQEKKIRMNPAERVSTLLQRVFGQLDKK